MKIVLRTPTLLIIWVWLVACNRLPAQIPQPPETVETGLLPLPSPQAVPPTFTPSGQDVVPIPTFLPTQPPQPTEIPDTPIPFDDVVVTARVRIPAIGYDRRLEGNIGSELIFVDESAGKGQFRARQAVILIELQQVLEELVLAPVPEGCDQCVDLEVTFPLEEIAFRGWLQDPILLASLENLFSITLGPHFSPDAVAGLRRTASPYAPAQTMEVQANGTVLIWQANRESVVASFEASELLKTAVSQTVNTAFQNRYTAACEGVPIETMMLKSDSGGIQMVTIACPAFSIPLPLHDLYVHFDQLMGEAVLDAIPSPDTGVPLTAVLQYQREDGILMLVNNDGGMTLNNGAGELITDTLSVEQMTTLTIPLFESGLVSLGLTTFATEEGEAETAVIYIRGPQGLYDGAWRDTHTIPELANLNNFIDSYLVPPAEESTPPTETKTPSPEDATSPAETETPIPTATP